MIDHSQEEAIILLAHRELGNRSVHASHKRFKLEKVPSEVIRRVEVAFVYSGGPKYPS
jgi:hypothetical protein